MGHTLQRLSLGTTCHQQTLYKNVYFYQNLIGILINRGNTISITGAIFDNVNTAVRHDYGVPWIALIDATSINSGVTFVTTGQSTQVVTLPNN